MLESAELQLVVMLLPPSLSLENRVGHAHGGQVLVHLRLLAGAGGT